LFLNSFYSVFLKVVVVLNKTFKQFFYSTALQK